MVYSLVSRAGAENAVEIGCVENGSRDDPLGSVLVLRDVSPRRELRQAEMKVFFVSGYKHDAMDQFGGPDLELLLKPFPGSELVRRVRQLLAQPAARIA